MLKVYVDGEYREDVAGLDTVKETYYFNDEILAYVHEITGDIIFLGSLYTDTVAAARSNICNEMDVKIVDDGVTTLFSGKILYSDLTFDHTHAEVRVEITDKGIIGLLDNNKRAECRLNADFSKNGVPLDPITHLTNIGFVDPTSTTGVTGRDGIRLFDALDRLVRFCSDNTLSVRSDYFDSTVGNTSEPQKWAVLMTGNELRVADQSLYPSISFEDLIQDVNKLYNIAIALEDEFYIRIEPKRYFRNDTLSPLQFRGVDRIEQQSDPKLFNTNVIYGSTEATTQFDYLEETTFLSQETQRFHLGGQCNLPSELQLNTKDLVYDTNVIQRVLPVSVSGANDDMYDRDNFIIVVADGAAPNYGRLKQVPYSALSAGYYNDSYCPYQIAPRWFGEVPFSIYAYLGGTGGNDAIADNNANQNINANIASTNNVFIDFPNDVSDPNGNFQTSVINQPFPYAGSVSHYNSNSGGLFSVRVTFDFYGDANWLFFVVLDAAGNEQYIGGAYNFALVGPPEDPTFDIGDIPTLLPVYQTQGTVSVDASLVVPMASNNNIVVYFPFANGIISNARIEINAEVGGRFQGYSFKDSDYMISTFEYDIPTAERNQLIGSPYDRFIFDNEHYEGRGRLISMEREIESSRSTVKLSGKL